MNTKVLARYFSALCIINNGLNWWKRFSYNWIELFSQDKLMEWVAFSFLRYCFEEVKQSANYII